MEAEPVKDRWNVRPWLLVLVTLLVGLRVGGELSGRGAAYWNWDLHTLQREQAAFYSGIYPHAAVEPGPAGEPPLLSSYPPTSFVLFLPWLPPGLAVDAAAWWFRGCQLAGLAFIIGCAWRRVARGDRGLGWLLGGAVLAMTGLRADLLFGNVSTIAVALLMVLLAAIEEGRTRSAAAAWLLALVKPQVGWLFGLVFWRRRQWRSLAGVLVALGVSAGLACWWTGVTAAQVLRAGDGEAGDFAAWDLMNNLVVFANQAGVPLRLALAGGAAAGAAAGWWLLRTRLAAAEPLRQFAVIGLLNRLCTYHNFCDDLLLVFALFWLGRRAWRSGGGVDGAVFAGFLASVAMPTSLLGAMPVRAAVLLCWLAAIGWICRTEGPAPAAQ